MLNKGLSAPDEVIGLQLKDPRTFVVLRIKYHNIQKTTVNVSADQPTRPNSDVHWVERGRILVAMQQSQFTFPPDDVVQIQADADATTHFVTSNRPAVP